MHSNWMSISLVLACLASPGIADEIVAVRGGRIVPVVGPEIEDATILLREGRIVAIGREVEVPMEARVLDARGKWIVPGLVVAHTSSGVDVPDEMLENVPFVNVRDSVNPDASFFRSLRRDGVTTVGVFPGRGAIVGGTGIVVRAAGRHVDSMIFEPEAGLKISLVPRRGSNRMDRMAKLRSILDGARRRLEDREDDEAPIDFNLRPLAALLAGEIPAFVACARADDALRAMELGQRYGIRIVLEVGADIHRAAHLLDDLDSPVVLGPTLEVIEVDERGRDLRHRVARRLFDEGVAFCLTPAYGSRPLWLQAAICLRQGVDRATVLRLVTIEPARVLGLDDRIGSIEVGKLANLTILSGEPFGIDTFAETVLIEGSVVYRIEEDEALQRLRADPEDSE